MVVKTAAYRLRCTACHLTLDEADLASGDCPECLEESGRSHSDFERIPNPESSKPQYRCDDCGTVMGGDEA
jgi:predicted RNA-binding Zn-ribbon protein involved in translation (DUF1610 family)